MEACYGGTDVMGRSCAVARGIDINSRASAVYQSILFNFSSPCTKFPGSGTEIIPVKDSHTRIPVIL